VKTEVGSCNCRRTGRRRREKKEERKRKQIKFKKTGQRGLTKMALN